jgi:ankyrin repeat protein
LKKNYIHNRLLTQRHKLDIQQKEWKFLTQEQKETVYSYVSKPNQFFFLTKVGETEKIKNLIEKTGDIPDEALHLAARYGNLDLVKYLFKIKPNFTHYVINEAIQKNHIDIAKYLIDKGAQIGHTSIKYAAENGNLDFVKYLTKKYLNQIGTNEKDLYIQKYLTQDIVSSATYSGNLDLVKYFIEDLKLQPDISALSWAVQTGNLDLVKYLIDKGANTYNSLQMAAKMGNLDIVKYLSKFNPNEDDLAEALERAAENQHLNIVKHLVEKEGATLKKPLYSISTTNKEIKARVGMKFKVCDDDKDRIYEISSCCLNSW